MRLKSALKKMVLLAVALAVSLQSTGAWAAPATGKSTEAAADLRMRMNNLYGEYALLSWSAILLAGSKKHQSDFQSAVSALDDNANRLGRLYAQIYGDRAGADFTSLWKKQVASIVDYAQASAKKNTTAQDVAGRYLVDTFPGQLGGLLGGITHGGHAPDVVSAAAKEWMTNMRAVADAQAIRDFNNEYRAVDKVYAIMGQMAHDEAAAAVKAFPTNFVGNIDMPAVNLRVQLNALFAQQMFTLAMANRANFSSNIDEYWALFARSDLLTDEISAALGTYGGAELKTSFSGTWKKYTASLQDLEKAREAQDGTMSKRVLGDINGHANDVVALFVPAPPTRAVPPPKKGGKRPKAPPPPPFFKDVKAFMDANVAIIYKENGGHVPYGKVQKAWNDTRPFTDSLTGLLISKFGDKPQNAQIQGEGK